MSVFESAPQGVPQKLQALVEHFRKNRETHRGPGFKEASLRREFADPFIELLGWDMQNRARTGRRLQGRTGYGDVLD